MTPSERKRFWERCVSATFLIYVGVGIYVGLTEFATWHPVVGILMGIVITLTILAVSLFLLGMIGSAIRNLLK